MEFDYSKEPGKMLTGRYITSNIEPLVSIITPFYNSGCYFESTYRSVLNQTFPYFEWIIVNDFRSSTTDCEILHRLSGTDCRIRVITTDRKGIPAARNIGIHDAKTDIIITLDADDLIEPTYVESIYWALYNHPEAAWAYTDTIGFCKQEYVWEKFFSSRVMKKENILTYSAGIRRSALIEVGCYDELDIYYYEDWYLWLKLLRRGMFPLHIRQKGFWYRRTNSGALSFIRKNSKLNNEAARVIKEIAKEVPNDIYALETGVSKPGAFIRPQRWPWERTVEYTEEKIRVLILAPHMEMGGSDIFNLDIISRLDSRRYEVGIITTTQSSNTWKQRFAELTSDVFDLAAFLHFGDWGSFVAYYIDSRKVGITLIANSYFGYYLVPWLRKEFPQLAIVDYVHMEEWGWRAGGYARASSAVGSILDKTYVSNEHLRGLMISHFKRKPDSVQTLYIGVDDEHFKVTCIDRDEHNIRIKEIDSRPVVLFPCRIEKQKRPDLMLEIARGVKRYCENICFLVVGDGSLLADIKRKARKMGLSDTVLFVGRQADLRAYYNMSRLTLICSSNEGLAITAYESLAMGVPVVSADVGGQRELIDFETGFLVPACESKEAGGFFDKAEVDAYVRAIIELLQNNQLYQKMSANCRQRIERDFSKNLTMGRMAAEFDELLRDTYVEGRVCLSRIMESLVALPEEYLVLHNEYESTRIEHRKLDAIVKTVKDLLLFRIGPLSVLRGLVSQKDNIYVKELFRKYKVERILRLAK